jgi:predicted RNase H-like HicB family nuclease
MVVSSKAMKPVATHDGQSVDELRENMASSLQVMLRDRLDEPLL